MNTLARGMNIEIYGAQLTALFQGAAKNLQTFILLAAVFFVVWFVT